MYPLEVIPRMREQAEGFIVVSEISVSSDFLKINLLREERSN